MSWSVRNHALSVKGEGSRSLGCCLYTGIGQLRLCNRAQLDPLSLSASRSGEQPKDTCPASSTPGRLLPLVLSASLCGPWSVAGHKERVKRVTDNTVGTGEKNGSPNAGDHRPSCNRVRLLPFSFPLEEDALRSLSHTAMFSSFSPEDTIPKKVVCRFSGKTYADEERWDIDSCTHCYCLQGQTLCSTVSCPPLPCAEPIKVEGSCCPMCPGI